MSLPSSDKPIPNKHLVVEGLSKSFSSPSGSTEVLSHVDFTVDEGQVVSLTGPSGAGKSTLLQILGLLSKPSSGSYAFCGTNTETLSAREINTLRSDHIGFVFQKHLLLPELSLYENVALPLARRQGWGSATQKQTELWLEKLELNHRQHARPFELSGGEAQRGAIARALIHNPSLLLMDEPTGNLDPELSTGVMEDVFELCKTSNTTCVFVTHNMTLAAMAERRAHVVQHRLEEVSS
jgi:lipoprotein-releasing system ATP-binding protein